MTPSFEYLERRLEFQEKWHNDKARWNKRLFYTVEVTTVLAGAAIPVVNLWAVNNAYLAGLLSAVFGGIVVVAVAMGKLFKFHENWLQYRAVAETLACEKELYLSGAADYAAAESAKRNQLLVERVENILTATTSQFVATHRALPTDETH